MDESSVTRWIVRLRSGHDEAVQRLWERYFTRMVRLARRRLADSPRRVQDEEDVALSAFKSFCLGIEQGRFPQLVDRHDLWSLLVAITAHKVIDVRRHEQRVKRGGRLAQANIAGEGVDEFAELISHEPTPAFAAQISESLQHLLNRLAEPELREIAILKMEGCYIEEIASRLGCTDRTIKRKLQRIRTLWLEEESS